MIQNQLENKPKQWDKRGVVVQAHPEIRQYKVMVFGSRWLSLRNRRFLRKYQPVRVPDNAPLGLPKRLNPTFPHSTAASKETPTMQDPAPPPPEISLECDPDCCIRPIQSQQSPAQTQATTLVQKEVPTLPQVPVAVANAPDPVTVTPVHLPEPAPVHTTPDIPCPAPCSVQPPALAATPRRSTRAGRGTISKYEDYLLGILVYSVTSSFRTVLYVPQSSDRRKLTEKT